VDTQDPFDALLDWLHPNREIAGRKYKNIHDGLVRIFVSRGFSDAEDLADQTIKRVTALLPEIKETYVGEREPFFYKVARYIMLEAWRRPEIATDVVRADPTQETSTSDTFDRLLECLDLLSEEQRDLILDYYLYTGRDKIEHHKRMALARGISVGALRSRVHHLKETLEKCVRQRLKDR